jgi:hypothetical protein
MALETKRKDKESPQNLVHRFTKTVRQSGLLLELRKKRFRIRAKSFLAKKKSALRRVRLVAEKKRQEKLSKPK